MKKLLLLLMLLCSFPFQVQAEEKIKLALNWKAEPQFGGFYNADREKLFQVQGLEVQILEGGSGTPTVQMLAAGKTDYAIVSADEIILAHDRGARDLVAVFATYQTNPQGIMTHADRNYQSLADLFADEKATLLWQSGLPYAQYLKKKHEKFLLKTAPYLGGILNFQKDPLISQQCFVTSEPLAAKRANLKVKTFLVAESGYNPYTTVVAVKASRLKEKPLEVQKMVEAIRRGWQNYLKNPEKTNEWMRILNKSMDAKTFAESATAQKDLIETEETRAKGLGVMTELRWKQLVDQLLELKLIKKELKATDLFFNPSSVNKGTDEKKPAPTPAA